MDEHHPDRQALQAQLAHFRFGMLTTFDAELGQLRSRPMTNQQLEFDGTLWFFTADTTGTYREVTREHHVNLSYADPDAMRFVSVSGLASVVRDRERASALWSPVYQAFFPGGLDDPHLVLLRVDITQAEYWEASSGRMVQLYRLAKAALTGRPADLGTEHRRLDRI
ncbi:pyridoxamine 5'-phosphate oxidase family protein [Chitiniphilus purpureus]|uniref:Pyridoxamine 5'-phosphate oxidase family protein n=1 Tax=Chitiniphilus purpureus TaxID=2981137 RepID=A0ABY6DSP4_9NEIS|nr:pyridoxamine 5'-phosphate oxidase family protein [Chitiniphilus sp. CD1]UXY17042.1 pyridoxamine 5'-phosphate oxidase family protein [Chitiniphilus sp. CD1]